MKDFYTRFYTAIQHSRAYSLFCERVFGLDLGQHGFADVQQLDLLLETAALTPRSRALDMGCGDGRITEYLSDRSGAHFVGLDYIEAAVEAAMTRTAPKRERLSFITGDLNHLELPAVNLLDAVISIDTLYFSEDYPRTLRQMADLLKPGGILLILFSHGREPWVPLEEFDPLTLPPANTPVGQALAELGFPFQTVELTDADYRLALRRKEVLDDLRGMFEAEGNLFLYENRMGDACGISDAIERGLQRRYLYCVQPSGRRD
ncbi:MAG: class I SAM-dependent methyltransferase [Anaerolineaceae bacterium]